MFYRTSTALDKLLQYYGILVENYFSFWILGMSGWRSRLTSCYQFRVHREGNTESVHALILFFVSIYGDEAIKKSCNYTAMIFLL